MYGVNGKPSRTCLRGMGSFSDLVPHYFVNIFSEPPKSFFKASALLADAFYKSKCNVRLCVCLSVCVCVCSLLRYRLTVFLPPTSRSRMSNIFRDLGKIFFWYFRHQCDNLKVNKCSHKNKSEQMSIWAHDKATYFCRPKPPTTTPVVFARYTYVY